MAAGFLGIILGSAATSSTEVESTPEYRALAEQRAELEDALADSESELKEAQSELEEVEGSLPAREAAVEKARQEIATAEERLDARDAVLDRRARAVSRREDAVSLVENTIEQNTIEGDGLYEVGGDIKAGTYKTEGSPGCYYAVLSSPDTFDILNNNNTSGPAVVTVSDGQYLELSRCADWVWQG